MATFHIKTADGAEYDVEAPDEDAALAALGGSSAGTQQAAPQQRSWGQEIGRQLGLTARVPFEALGAIPMALADAGVGARNLLTGSNYELPSKMWEDSLDSVFPKRETLGEKIVGFGANVVAGSKIPTPGAILPKSVNAPSVPANFAKGVNATKAKTLSEAQKLGYVVPPATGNPTAVNKALEGFAGKASVAQTASARNTEVTTNIAKRALGLAEDAPLTAEAIQAVRQEAAAGYDAVRNAGRVVADAQYKAALTQAASRTRSVAKDFPELAGDEVEKIVQAVNKDSFDSASAIDAISLLRDKADDAYRLGSKQAGVAYRALSKALEDLVERNLSRQGKNGADALKSFRDARQLIAKTYTVEDAFNSATGGVSAAKLGSQLAKGAPLSGELKDSARFAQAFPKTAREFNESLPGISPLDFYAAGGTSALTKEPAYLLYPFLRQGVRNALFTGPGQRLAMPPETNQLPRAFNPLFGVGNALLVSGQQ